MREWTGNLDDSKDGNMLSLKQKWFFVGVGSIEVPAISP